MKRDDLIKYIARIISAPRMWPDDCMEENEAPYWERVSAELLTAMEKHPEIVVGVREPIKPAELTPEEIADLIVNDEDLQESKDDTPKT